MKNSKKAVALMGMGAIALMICGCGAKKFVRSEAPVKPAAQESVKAEKFDPLTMEQYQVKKGDTLWAISFLERVYSDSSVWPLIFKANRGRIQDPDQIEPGQVLLYKKEPTAAQKSRARQLASDTPIFKAHVGPREPLPLDYF